MRDDQHPPRFEVVERLKQPLKKAPLPLLRSPIGTNEAHSSVVDAARPLATAITSGYQRARCADEVRRRYVGWISHVEYFKELHESEEGQITSLPTKIAKTRNPRLQTKMISSIATIFPRLIQVYCTVQRQCFRCTFACIFPFGAGPISRTHLIPWRPPPRLNLSTDQAEHDNH